MAEYLAHSAQKGFPAQTYKDHVQGVQKRGIGYAKEAEEYYFKGDAEISNVVCVSARYHDLGKLEEENQKVLRANSSSRLPINHVDAGCAALLKQKAALPALIVYAHHRGLPDMQTERNRGKRILRDADQSIRENVDQQLPHLLERQQTILGEENYPNQYVVHGDRSIFYRMALSCLADADHSDTAVAFHQEPMERPVPLLPEKRLQMLDRYVEELPKNGERGQLRKEMYMCCRNAKVASGFTICDSPVGSGKTTAVMAHLLRQAIVRGARRIFVVLPYTSIIQQSVAVYRQALTLPGENPEKVVAEHHCRADYDSENSRYLTALWRAPIVVTTSVAFFETLASNMPSGLRRLHELPGSMIFVDEAHNALPIKLLPLAWQWMNHLAEEWGCYWVLASGSLVRFWKLTALADCHLLQPQVNELVDQSLRERLSLFEKHRVLLQSADTALSRSMLVQWVLEFSGPRLLILNTVQSAAVIANDFRHMVGSGKVEHLSSALSPEDQKKTIKHIYERLKDKQDTDWTLIATSCVEAGVDFSFKIGFREEASLLSLLQASGRVNRHGMEKNALMWSFRLQDDSKLRVNPALADSQQVLEKYFQSNQPITAELSTTSINDEIVLNDSGLTDMKELLKMENAMQFREIADAFHVIEADTVLAVTDEALANEVVSGKSDWQSLQNKAVVIRRNFATYWKLRELAPDIFQWTLGYDSFLGYMCGVIGEE